MKISLMHFCCIKSETESYYRIKLKCRIFNVQINMQSGPSNVSYLAPFKDFIRFSNPGVQAVTGWAESAPPWFEYG